MSLGVFQIIKGEGFDLMSTKRVVIMVLPLSQVLTQIGSRTEQCGTCLLYVSPGLLTFSP